MATRQTPAPTAQRRGERRSCWRRRAAVDIALALAELNATWGDWERAIEHLDSADELSGGALRERFETQRSQWMKQAAARQSARARSPRAA